MARLLLDRGFKKVRPLLGGFDAWVTAGYPLDGLEELPSHTATLPSVSPANPSE